jgi:hypothetical protein
MIKYKIHILPVFILIVCGVQFSFCTTKQIMDNKIIADSSLCDSVIFNDKFSQMPLGRTIFTQAYLSDTLFRGYKRAECTIYSPKEEERHSITFYTGALSYFTFNMYYRQDKYFLDYFELHDDNIFLLLNNGQKFGINYTKEYLSNTLSCSNNLCNEVYVTGDEGNAVITILFQGNKAKKIIYRNNL